MIHEGSNGYYGDECDIGGYVGTYASTLPNSDCTAPPPSQRSSSKPGGHVGASVCGPSNQHLGGANEREGVDRSFARPKCWVDGTRCALLGGRSRRRAGTGGGGRVLLALPAISWRMGRFEGINCRTPTTPINHPCSDITTTIAYVEEGFCVC